MEHVGGVNPTEFRARFFGCDLPDPNSDRQPAPDFHGFLENSTKWCLTEHEQLMLLNQPNGEDVSITVSSKNDERTRFVQRWLYFELLRGVFGPGLNCWDFVSEDGGYITTSKLKGYCSEWQARELVAVQDKQPQAQEAHKRRMAQVQQTLDSARGWVSKYCAVKTPGGLPLWPIEKLVANTIIVLGETLSHWLINFQQLEEINFRLPGWHNHDLEGQGWGYSKAVLEKFKIPRWCPKTVHMLQSLMKKSTIGLLLAHCNSMDFGVHIERCTIKQCQVELDKSEQYNKHAKAAAFDQIAEAERNGEDIRQKFISIQGKLMNDSGSIDPAHTEECRRSSGTQICKPEGPEPDDLQKILDAKNVPLFSYSAQKGLKVHSMPGNFKEVKPFIVFSHVFKDNYGNPEANTLQGCMLRRLSDMCDQAMEKDPTAQVASSRANHGQQLFWIDTLALPADIKQYRKERDEAISQIHKIYETGTYTIVLDSCLEITNPGSEAGAAMQISLSKWISRLWTLQEAVLSNRILINFNGELHDLKNIEQKLENKKDDFHVDYAAARAYFSGMLGAERDIIKGLRGKSGKTEPQDLGGPKPVASLWRAVQWRESDRPHHETLALAILLKAKLEKFTKLSGKEAPDDEEGFMVDLIRELADKRRIPAGMIFLPGQKLKAKGYRWAPKTWLTAAEIMSPDPLQPHTDYQLSTRLGNRGLHVRYPGYRLHALMEQRVRTLRAGEHFYFPIHYRLREWIAVRCAGQEDHDEPFPSEENLLSSKLAIIAMCFPVTEEEQSGLLVAIKREEAVGEIEVERLCRVFLHRESNRETLEKLKFQFHQSEAAETPVPPMGEELLFQDWVVDGPEDRQLNPLQPEEPLENKNEAEESNDMAVTRVPPGDTIKPDLVEDPSSFDDSDRQDSSFEANHTSVKGDSRIRRIFRQATGFVKTEQGDPSKQIARA